MESDGPALEPVLASANEGDNKVLVFLTQVGIQAYVMKKHPCVYILASQRNGTLYIGVTSDLVKRGWEHRNSLVDGFTKKYRVHRLVYYETHADMTSAITREKQLKKWNRVWKLRLIEECNPEWRDLWEDIV